MPLMNSGHKVWIQALSGQYIGQREGGPGGRKIFMIGKRGGYTPPGLRAGDAREGLGGKTKPEAGMDRGVHLHKEKRISSIAHIRII
jgi:hypothetical protein